MFYNVFKKHGVPISMEEARLPMGLRKDLHIEQILEIPDVKERWTRIKGHEPTSSDVDTLFEDFFTIVLTIKSAGLEILLSFTYFFIIEIKGVPNFFALPKPTP